MSPSVRTDIVQAFVCRRAADQVHVLQCRRALAPLAGTWQPIMGHVEPGETAQAAALREAREEVGLTPAAIERAWQLEEVHPYFLAAADAIVLSPGFVFLVHPDWSPTLDDAHDACAWRTVVHTESRPQLDTPFLWPGQNNAVAEIMTLLADPDSTRARAQRLVIDA